MQPRINFTPGPSQLYFTVEDHIKAAFKEGVPTLSHRSKQFEGYYKDTVDGLRQLLNLPSGYEVYFTGSATEIWERLLQNLVEEKSFHLVNGSFSKRFYETALQLGRKPEKTEVAGGHGFAGNMTIPSDAELIAATHNETSTGVSMPLEMLYGLKSAAPNAILAVDAVSSLPFPDFDYSRLDSVFFSVQKGFGLPAGLGVWMVNEKCVAKADAMLSKGKSIGSYHTIPSLRSHGAKYQTPETPNVLGIYLLSKVIGDMLRKGITAIRRETEYKSTLLYQTLDNHGEISAFVKDKALRSKTVIVADCGEHTATITKKLMEKGMMPGDGYGPAKKTQLRFANFPTHSKEQFELLVDMLA